MKMNGETSGSAGWCNGSFLRYERVLVGCQLEPKGWYWRYGHLLDAQSLRWSNRLTGRAQLPLLQPNGLPCPFNAEQNHGANGRLGVLKPPFHFLTEPVQGLGYAGLITSEGQPCG
jgi:hypothetical protein